MLYIRTNTCPKCGKLDESRTAVISSPPEPGTERTSHADTCINCHVKTLTPEQAARMWRSMGD